MLPKGIKFDDIHSYDDLNLILSKSEISPAPAKTNFIEVPGADGSLDATEAHGEVKYGNRDCKFTFTMNPMGGDLSDSAFEKKKTEVSNALNGLACQIVLDKDPDVYYEGRFSVNEYLSDKRLRQIVVTGVLKPYKMKVEETIATVKLSSVETEINLINGRKSVVPEIECTEDDVVIVYEGNTFTLGAGIHEILEICLYEGNNFMKVSGSGTVTFKYREGDL